MVDLKKLNFTVAAIAVFFCITSSTSFSQAFKVGERISYSISFDNYQDVAYAELSTLSRGKLAGKDAVELFFRLRTLDFFNAAFMETDQERRTFVAPDSGMPLFVSIVNDPTGFRSEKKIDLTDSPVQGFDLVSLIARMRSLNGSGTAAMFEGDQSYQFSFQPAGTETLKTPIGDLETSIVNVESTFLDGFGLKKMRVNLSNDEARIPVEIRVMKGKSEIAARMSSYVVEAPEPTGTPEATPTPVTTPRPIPTPTPAPTPEPYQPNRPLASELAFDLGEVLEYRLTSTGRPAGSFVLRARERKQIAGRDTLVLTATVTNAVPGISGLGQNDSITAEVDPETLFPFKTTSVFGGGLAAYSQDLVFDSTLGNVVVNNREKVPAPVGVHSILSLFYAMRSFNLSPSRSTSDPDTRVAVFWGSQPYIFTLRPSDPVTIERGDKKVPAQIVSITTRIPEIDQLGLKVWLSMDANRLPLRIVLGQFQADLASFSNVPPQ